MAAQAVDPVIRFTAKFEQRGPDECWPWTAATFEKGYGAFRLGNRQTKAHRFSYEHFVGPIPDGLYVCHTCDNPPCVNPDHLFLGTHYDNAVDRETKGRGAHQPPGPRRQRELASRGNGRARGERHGVSKLSAADVQDIRRRRAAGESQQRIADRFGVTQKNVSNIVRRVTWSHVD